MTSISTNIEQYIPFKISKIIEETDSCKTFVLNAPEDYNLSYTAGQYITFAFDSKNGEERRSYSFSSAPDIDKECSITVKRIANGSYSRYFNDKAKVGDVVYCTSISGRFTLPNNIQHFKHIFLLAAGSGIVPIFSILKEVLYHLPHLRITLIYSNKSVPETIFYHQLNALQQQFGHRFQIDYLFSTAKNILRSRLNNSLLTDIVKMYSTAPFNQTLFYTCGPVDYMDTVTITLLTEGIPKAHLRKEIFVTYQPELKALPPDTTAHTVTLLLPNQSLNIEVQYPDSILQKAKKTGIALPYSCQSGQCGSCAALCIEGEVWMAYNEVLTDQDIAKGLVLTCQGYPIHGNVVLQF